jgi:GPI biosynthesis protein family Pig-F
MPPTSLSSILPAPPNSEAKGRRLLTPTTNAIPSIVAKGGRKYNALHTTTVTALFALQFRALVSDPYRVMLLDLVPLVVLQCAYCVVCLPATGTWPNTSGSTTNETAGITSGKGAKPAATGSSRKRPVGMGRIGAVASGGWKAKVMVTWAP